MKVVFIAGPYRADNSWDIEENIRRAETAALAIWRMGAAVICPHTNTRFFQGTAPDDAWINGALEILRRCDAVYALPNSEQSRGTHGELHEAKRRGIPIFRALIHIDAWIKTQ